ncbi:hypothetical protein H0H93_000831 [Arthromyces matolae]|nr:hypothetical protein H0H93_000831 [Arthromyces matolae]
MPGLFTAEPDAMPLSPGDSTPKNRPSTPQSRRETILNLVEMLLQNSESSRDEKMPSFEDDRDVRELSLLFLRSVASSITFPTATVDEHLQVAGAETFHKFKKRIDSLDKELRNFAHSARQLGSSVAILSSAFDLRARLAQLLFLYHENAADLFPRKIAHIAKESSVERPKHDRHGRARKRTTKGTLTQPHAVRPTVDETLDLEEFPNQLKLLAKAVRTFSNCLNEFPEFTDEAVNTSISEFEGDLDVRFSTSPHPDPDSARAVLGILSKRVYGYIHDLSEEMGEHMDSITATLAIKMADAVNVFWFASLVFSIAAAVNSLLGLTWKQAMYRSPGDRVPWWVLIWIKRSPLVFLVVSVACFSIGLCLFAYASDQAPATSTLTTIFTAFTSFGLTAVSAWFASERYIYLRHQGRKWLGDALTEYSTMVMSLPGMEQSKLFLELTSEQLVRWTEKLQRICAKLLCIAYAHSSSSESTADVEAGPVLPFANPNNVPLETLMSPRRVSDVGSEPPKSPPFSPTSPVISENTATDSVLPSPVSPGKQLWNNALRSVRMHSALSVPFPQPHRRRTTSSNVTTTTSAPERKKTMMPDDSTKIVMRSRVAALSPKLKQLAPTQDVEAHSGLVRHLQFSPDGRFLATSSWDRTSVIFRVGDPLESHRTLAHPAGFVGQVAWAPSGNLLLTKLSRGIKVWTTEVLDQYDFGRMKLHDVAVTPDSIRLIGVGPLLESPDGLQPSKSRAEKRLVVYNMETNLIEK